MTISVAIFIFPDVEVLDFSGPYEVFTAASRVSKREPSSGPDPFRVFTVAQKSGTICARAGLVVVPDYTFANHPSIDLLIIPGGIITTELQQPSVQQWIARSAETAKLTASVCTGSFLLAQAGLLDGRRAATHWEDARDLKAMFPSLTVVEDQRWVDEGGIVTSAGIAAGIDMCLHLVARLCGNYLARNTARQLDFAWREIP